ncbi:phage major capsid protein [Bacillus subtilis]|uniref:phage major capsid protein n=1 Tax=Bacillus subtilis TaxID=1423 RepID=UPI002DBE2F3B|nr:phage major capsid protein [Bacillus subtilis]MEC2197839.1 phage major capsid protein [Bacillus subtilis]
MAFNPNNVLMQDAKTGSVPVEEGTLVLKEFMTKSVVTQLAKYEEMDKTEKIFTYLASGPGAYWVGEGERIQTSKAEWLTAKMVSKKIGVIIPVTKEFLRYSIKDFFTSMQTPIAEAFALKFDQAALFGNGSPFGEDVSIFEKIEKSGNKVQLGSLGNLYKELNGVISLIEEADKDPNGFTTTRRFKQPLRGAVDDKGTPIFNDPGAGATNSALGLPIGYVNSDSWDYSKAHLLTGNWDYARYGIPQGMEYSISEDATLHTIAGPDGKPVSLFEQDMVALRVTQQVGFMTLAEDAFAALTPAAEGTGA